MFIGKLHPFLLLKPVNFQGKELLMFEGGESYRGVDNWLGGVGYGVNVYGA